MTVEEEAALAGAKAFDVSQLRGRFGYVFDHATPIGEIVMASPTYYRLEAEFRGRAAHAGIRPEDGRRAIVAAARAIAAMRHGRLDEETTANIGWIEGGSGATNIVARALHAAGRDALAGPRGRRGRRRRDGRPLPRRRQQPLRVRPRRHRRAALRGLPPQGLRARRPRRRARPGRLRLRAAPIVSGGASDANAFEAEGFQSVSLANGTERNHEPTERVSVAALEGMLDV